MTRRIAIAILATVWSMLAIGGAAAYWGVREMLLEELDQTLLARASALPGTIGPDRSGGMVLPAEDRFIVRDAAGRTLARPPEAGRGSVSVKSRGFASLPELGRVRSVTVSIAPPNGGSAYTVVYSGSARRFDRTMTRLVVILVGIGLGSGVATLGIALLVSRSVMKPLRRAATAIAAIDERKLDHRIESSALPVEVRPITERLNEMLHRLELAFAQRKQFLADAAHELRTPVAALLTTLEVSGRRSRTGEAMAQTLQSCLADARLLKRLTETLLEQARLESPAQQPLETVDIANLVREVAAALRPLAEAKQIELRVETCQRAMRSARLNAVQSVLMNLISNAIEYSPAGGWVRVQCRTTTEGSLELEIADSGPGIPKADLAHVFEPFFRGDAARTHKDGHLGLGLFMVQSHVAKLGGRCIAANAEGGGAVFTVVWPPAETDRPETVQQVAATSPTMGTRDTILAATTGGGGR